MKLYRHLLLALLLSTAFSASATNDVPIPESDSNGGGHHDHGPDCPCGDHERKPEVERCPLKGTYAYEISGSFGAFFPVTNTVNEAGSITFNGKGKGTATGVSIVNGLGGTTSATLFPSYTFTYTWISSNVALASAVLTSALGTANIQFAVGVGDQAEHITIVLLPNATPIFSSPLQAGFNFVEISGTGGK